MKGSKQQICLSVSMYNVLIRHANYIMYLNLYTKLGLQTIFYFNVSTGIHVCVCACMGVCTYTHRYLNASC